MATTTPCSSPTPTTTPTASPTLPGDQRPLAHKTGRGATEGLEVLPGPRPSEAHHLRHRSITNVEDRFKSRRRSTLNMCRAPGRRWRIGVVARLLHGDQIEAPKPNTRVRFPSSAPFTISTQRPRTARRPSSMASRSGRASLPARSASRERSINSRPSGTATESIGRPVTAAVSNTLPARPARSRFDVSGTTWVCQTSTPRTSSDDTTTHGRRLSSSTQ
jgi:hypothetical protein